jgi:hypothetical protein
VRWLTEEADNLLKQLWREGRSMSAVADALTEAIGAEVSRNAVAGRTRRLRELGHDIEARQVPERLVQAKEQPIHLPQRPEPAIMRPDVIVTHDDGVEY